MTEGAIQEAPHDKKPGWRGGVGAYITARDKGKKVVKCLAWADEVGGALTEEMLPGIDEASPLRRCSGSTSSGGVKASLGRSEAVPRGVISSQLAGQAPERVDRRISTPAASYKEALLRPGVKHPCYTSSTPVRSVRERIGLRLPNLKRVVRCFRCLGVGHFAVDCRDPVKCRACRKIGHKADSCKKLAMSLSGGARLNPNQLRQRERTHRLKAFVPLSEEYTRRVGLRENALLADVIQPADLGPEPQEAIANALARRFGGYSHDFFVARHRERDFAILLPRWVSADTLIRRQVATLEAIWLQCYVWGPDRHARPHHLGFAAWIQLRNLPFECWTAARVSSLICGFARFIRADETTKSMTDLRTYRCRIAVDHVSEIPRRLSLIVGDEAVDISIFLESYERSRGGGGDPPQMPPAPAPDAPNDEPRRRLRRGEAGAGVSAVGGGAEGAAGAQPTVSGGRSESSANRTAADVDALGSALTMRTASERPRRGRSASGFGSGRHASKSGGRPGWKGLGGSSGKAAAAGPMDRARPMLRPAGLADRYGAPRTFRGAGAASGEQSGSCGEEARRGGDTFCGGGSGAGPSLGGGGLGTGRSCGLLARRRGEHGAAIAAEHDRRTMAVWRAGSARGASVEEGLSSGPQGSSGSLSGEMGKFFSNSFLMRNSGCLEAGSISSFSFGARGGWSLGSVELTVGGVGTGPKKVVNCCSHLGGVMRGGDVASFKTLRLGLGKGGFEATVAFCAEGISCGFGGRWIKVAWGVGLCPVDLAPQVKGFASVVPRAGWETCSLLEYEVGACAPANAPSARLEFCGSAREGSGASEDCDEGGTSEVRQHTDSMAPFTSAGGPQPVRHSRRLASEDSTPILEKAMVRKERLLGGVGVVYGDRGRVKVPRIQAKSRLCGVRLDCDEANSFIEFVDTTNV